MSQQMRQDGRIVESNTDDPGVDIPKLLKLLLLKQGGPQVMQSVDHNSQPPAAPDMDLVRQTRRAKQHDGQRMDAAGANFAATANGGAIADALPIPTDPSPMAGGLAGLDDPDLDPSALLKMLYLTRGGVR